MPSRAATVSEVFIISSKETATKSVRHRKSVEIEAEAWKGHVMERIKLVQNGYKNLAIVVSTASIRIINGTL